MAKLTQEEILSYLEEATILELNDLVSAIEEKFGVVAAAAVAAPAAAAEEAAGPSEVTVTLTNVGGTKVAVIKAVREITGLGSIEPVETEYGYHIIMKTGQKDKPSYKKSKDTIKEKLVAAGATVEIK